METLNKLVGQKIKIRSPLFCCAPPGKICNKCAGEVPYELGIENIGLTSSSIGAGFLNLLLKSFHDSSVRTTTLDINRLILE